MSRAKLISLLVLSAMMVLVAWAAWALRPTYVLADHLEPINLEKNIPTAFEAWREDRSGPAHVVNQQVQDALSKLYTDMLTRTYIGPKGERIMLSIAYGRNQSDDKAVHYPEACYPAQGFNIMSRSVSSVDINGHQVPAKFLVTKSQDRTEPLMYWVTVGDKVALSGLQHKRAQLTYGFNGVIPDGLIFRVSSIGTDSQAAWADQKAFVNALMRSVSPSVRPRLMGV